MYENISHVLRGAALMFYILLCVGIYPRRNESNLSKLLFMSMLLLVVLYLKDMVFIDDELWKSEFVVNLVMMIDLLYVPMMALFFMEAVIPGWVRPDRTIMAFSIPFLSILLYIIFPYALITKIFIIYTILLGLIMFIVVLFIESERDKLIKNNFSDISNISVTWVKKAILAHFLNLLAWAFLTWNSTWIGDAIYFVVSIGTWIYIFSAAVKHHVVDLRETENNNISHDYSDEENCIDEKEDVFRMKLEQCMNGNKLFLNPKLTLGDLAKRIGTNRTYLSEYLNNHLNITFYEYINRFRTEMARSIIEDNPDITLLEVSEKSGFNSFSTFNRSFTKIIGTSPAKYAKRIGMNSGN